MSKTHAARLGGGFGVLQQTMARCRVHLGTMRAVSTREPTMTRGASHARIFAVLAEKCIVERTAAAAAATTTPPFAKTQKNRRWSVFSGRVHDQRGKEVIRRRIGG